jgi:hypothetical protein
MTLVQYLLFARTPEGIGHHETISAAVSGER